MKRPWYDLLLWIERIEPETSRSGFKGAVMAFGFLMFLVTPVGGNGNLLCTLIPGLCSGVQASEKDATSQHHYRMTPIIFYGDAHGHGCSCHLDMQRNGEEVKHFPRMAFTCDSEFDGDEENVWYVPGHQYPGGYEHSQNFGLSDGQSGAVYWISSDTGKYQWHCEGG